MKTRNTTPSQLFLAFCALAVLGGPIRAADREATDDDAAVEKRLADAARYLASDQLEGRGLGTHGIELAAEYIARQFQAAGLRTDVCGGQPYQRFSVTTDAELGSANRLALAGLPAGSDAGPSTVELTLHQDFTPLAASDSTRFDLPLVFGGYGITDRSAGYDDYAGVDVAGKAVVVLRHEPRQAVEGQGSVTIDSHHGLLRHKIANAYEHGAAAIVLCTDWNQLLADGAHEDRLVRFGTAGVNCSRPGMTVVHCRRNVLEPAIRAAYGTDLAGLEAEINRGPTPNSRALAGWRIAGRTDIRRIQSETKNVVAVLPGDGRNGNETLVIGAHYDHLGHCTVPGRQQAIYSGADDNASGVAAMLEIARHLAHRSQPPARRVVFVAFSAEEDGLLGSTYYVNHPVAPLSRTVAMLNLDMVGRLRDDRLYVRGTLTAAGWDGVLRDLDSRHGMTLDLTQGGLGRSDQLAFYANDVPILHFFTGRHADYHETSDKFEKLSIPGMRRVTRFVEDVLASLADAPVRPRCLAVAPPDDRDPYFGAFGDFTSSAPGYTLGPVVPGGPAARAGLRDGDVVVRVGDSRVAGVEDFKEALTRYGDGERVSVVVQREKQTRAFTVLLGSSLRAGKKMVAN